MTSDLIQTEGFTMQSRSNRRRARQGLALATLLMTIALILSIAAVLAVISFNSSRAPAPAKSASMIAIEGSPLQPMR